MPYTKQTWTDYDSATPISAARLAHIEDGVLAAGDPVAEAAARVAADNAESAARAAADTAHLVASDPHSDRADTTAKMVIHTTAADPHGDRADAAAKYVGTPTVTPADGALLVWDVTASKSRSAGTKPVVTGSRGGNSALASLLTALAGLGVITDSST